MQRRKGGVGEGGYWEPGNNVSKELWSTGSKAAVGPPEAPLYFTLCVGWALVRAVCGENGARMRLLWARREWEQEEAAGPFPYNEILG